MLFGAVDCCLSLSLSIVVVRCVLLYAVGVCRVLLLFAVCCFVLCVAVIVWRCALSVGRCLLWCVVCCCALVFVVVCCCVLLCCVGKVLRFIDCSALLLCCMPFVGVVVAVCDC